MMRRINNIKELQAEKKRLYEYRKALEGAVKNSWHEFRNTLKLTSLAKELLGKIIHR